MLTVVTPAASTRLVTIAAARAELRAGGDVTDAAIGALIDQASAAMAGYRGAGFGRRMLRETLRGCWGRPALMLSAYPVAQLVSLTAGGAAMTADAGFELDPTTGLIYRLSGGCRSPWAAGTVVVQYQDGWVLPLDPVQGQSVPPASDLPADLTRACLTLVSGLSAASGRDPSLRSESVAGVGSTTWAEAGPDAAGLPPQVAATLARYLTPVMA